MNAQTNFASILDKPASEVEKPKPLAAGTYLVVVKGMPEQGKSAKKKTDFVEFTLGFLQAQDDVDPDELKASLEGMDGKVAKLSDKTIKNTFYLTENSLWRLKDWLEALGLDIEGDASLGQLIEASPGCQIMITLGHDASDDGKSLFARIKDFAKAE